MKPSAPRRILTRSACALGLAAFAASPAHAVSEASELCTGNPCNITSNATIDDGALLDFGDRRVNVRANLDIGDGFVTIVAGSLVVDSNGRIRGNGGKDSFGGDLEIITTDDIELKGSPSDPPAIELTGCEEGILNLTSTAGDIISSREINMSRITATPLCTVEGIGGDFVINDAQNVVLDGRFLAIGGAEGSGGTVEVNADGDVSIADIDVSGGEGAFIDITAQGSVVLGDVDISGSGESGGANELIVDASQDITLNGDFMGRGATDPEFGGDGGFVTLFAGLTGHVQIRGSVNLNGRGPDGSGGELSIDASRVTISAPLEIEAQGSDGLGGILDITSDNTLISADVNTDSAAGGGDVTIAAFRSLTVNGQISADATGNSGQAGSIELRAENSARLTVGGSVHANARGNADDGGSVFLSGLIVEVGDASPVESEGDGGSILIRSCRRATLTGDFRAGPNGGLIEVEYATPTLPPLTVGSLFTPNPVITENEDMAFCVPEPGAAMQLLSVLLGLGAATRIRSKQRA